MGALFCGCIGSIHDPGNEDRPAADPGDPFGEDRAACDPSVASVGSAGLHRLTNLEYANTVSDLTGITPTTSLPNDESVLGFRLGTNVTPLHYELYMQAAEEVAEAMLDTTHARVAGTDGVVDASEARRFIEDFGGRAYRAPLTAEQTDRLVALFAAGESAEDDRNGIRLVLQGMLQSPRFLYRVELGAGPGPTPLTGYERASRLSFLLWDRGPDDELFAAAQAGQLADVSGVEAAARRLLADDRARPAVVEFYRQWLHLDVRGVTKDPDVYPRYDAALQASMETETDLFLEHVIFDVGTLPEMFLSTETFVDGALADLYGLDGVSGTSFVQRTLDPTTRSGILTRAGFLSVQGLPDQSSPIRRGVFVREHLLCQTLPPPPDDVDVSSPPLDTGTTTRERFQAHRSDPACASCHELIDPIGFGFEHYDGIGAFRDVEGGNPVDARGTISNLPEGTISFDDAIQMMEALAESETLQRCVGQQWYRYATQTAEGPESACALDAIHQRFVESDYDLEELLIALVTSDPFLHIDE